MDARVRMIAIDIDGTLMPSSGLAMSGRTRSALRQAEAAGVEIVIATGRRQAYAMPLLSPLGLRPQTVLIGSNGSVTRTFAGEPIDRSLLAVETARALCGELRSAGAVVFTFDREGPGDLVIESLEQVNARIHAWVESNRDHIVVVNPLERAFDSGEAPVQGMVAGTVDAMRAADEQLNDGRFEGLIETHRTEYASRDLSILDVLPPGCSKGSALRRLAERRGLRRDEVMAIGDNWNDLEMLEYAGHPVMMANAPEELLTLARERNWTVTATNDEDGAAKAVLTVLSARAAVVWRD
jgi:Cof subfamily protein (haloacid dehalogenase superfamily)